MDIYEIRENEEIVNYILIDSNGKPVIPVVKYLKFLKNNKAVNTLKTYCYHLKLYFEFLEQKKVDYLEVDINLLADFIGWLQNPRSTNILFHQKSKKKKRTAKTINLIMTPVLGFYDYLYRLEKTENRISDKVEKEIPVKNKGFKPFLYHLTQGDNEKKNLLKLKEHKKRIKILKNNDLNKIIDSCKNLRDLFLINLLYDTGLRIDEALSLWIEDFNISDKSIKVRKSKTRAGEGRTVYASSETMNLFQDYLFEIHDGNGFDTNFVFVTLQGKNRGEPLTYGSAKAMVDRLVEETGIKFTPHTLRHTFATELHDEGVDIAIIQKLLGHEQVQTTISLYIHPSDETIRREYEKAQENKKRKEDDKFG
ncbi:transposase [Robertmurraya yapensis]|uniref:Transposase n=1 Tax=Bacillus yapensis TaxID=2492960 RepID=A0A3S0JXM7_9BACI|nr:tyrosine-type recombinase/integrase [Bacillus yapensis]RTR31130.1 transposase [Bacillus yapensis]TKS95559.1 transposase [Bacillus yapensis]